MRIKNINLTIEGVDLETISNAIVDELDEDDIFEFVIGLDESVADYDFTVRLRNHLNDVIDDYVIER
jgi:hypothetical protein